jgi:hypothetical protein
MGFRRLPKVFDALFSTLPKKVAQKPRFLFSRMKQVTQTFCPAHQFSSPNSYGDDDEEGLRLPNLISDNLFAD